MTPTLDDDGAIPIAVDQLIAHTLVQANSGGGKTVACRRILEQTFGAMPQWVIDPEGEMHTLRERLPHLLAAPHGGDTVASVKAAPILCRRLLETGASCVIDIYDMSVDERHAFVKAFAEAAMNQPRTLWRDVLVAIDEAHRYCPERGEDPSEAAGAVKNWLTAGRKRGYAMILAVQRLSTLHKSAAAECNNRLIGRTGLDTDQDRAGKALGLRSPADKEALARMKPGRFWVYGPAFCERPTQVQIGPITTSHGREVRGRAPTPPLEEARKYLAQIGDLPAEAEAELKTMEQLKARIGELEKAAAIGKAWDSAAEDLAAKKEIVMLRGRLNEAQDAVKRLQDRLLAISPIVRDHAQKLVDMHDDLLESLAGMPKEPAFEYTPAGHVTIRQTGGVTITGIAKQPPGSTITLHENSAEVPATSRINGPVGPPVEPRARVQRDYSGNVGPRVERDGLTDRARTLLTVLAQRGRIPKGKAVIHSGYGPSGKISDAWADLARQGLIVSSQGDVEITEAGRMRLGPVDPLPSGPALLQRILARMDNDRARKLLQIVVDVYPGSISKGEAVKKSGYGPSGKISDAWAYLSARDYIVSRSGEVTAAKELCVP